VVLTEPVEIGLHISKTTAAMMAFPDAVVVGVCYGMQLLHMLHGGQCVEKKELRPPSLQGHEMLQKLGESQGLLAGLPSHFRAFCTNFIFCQNGSNNRLLPPGIRVTAIDRHKHPMAIEHENGRIHAVQFHPEESGTSENETGHCIVRNMMRLAARAVDQ